MYNRLQHFVEYGIRQLEENQKTFMENSSLLGEYVVRVKQVMLELGCKILSKMVEECSTMREDGVKRKIYWQIKDQVSAETVMRHVHGDNGSSAEIYISHVLLS